MITEQEIDHLEFVQNRLIEVYNESPNLDYLIEFRKILRKLREMEDPIDALANIKEQESPRSILWRECASNALSRGNDTYAKKVASSILEEYDNIFDTEQ